VKTIAVVLLVLLVQDASSPSSVTLPEGTLDAARERIYAPGEKGGIDVIQVSDGKLLTTVPCEGAPMPFAVDRDRVLVGKPDAKAANALRIVAISLPKGETVLTSDPLEFPDWVNAAGGRGHDVHWCARVEKSTLVISWEARYAYVPMGGPPPPPTPPKLACGVAKIDLAKGSVSRVDSVEDFVKVLAKDNAAYTRPVCLSGEILSAVSIGRELGIDKQPMLLRWDPAARRVKESIPIGQVGPQFLRRMADGRHAILPDTGSVLAVYSLETGKKVEAGLKTVGAKLAAFVEGADGGHLYTVDVQLVPLTRDGVLIPHLLRAWSPRQKTESDKPLWERAIKPGFGKAYIRFP
jgi:hypothetical protein